MNHLAFAMLESAMLDTPSDRRFSAFVAKVEQLLGVDDLDGDDAIDGYSLDGASDAFDDGATAAEYAADVRARLAALGRVPQNRSEDSP